MNSENFSKKVEPVFEIDDNAIIVCKSHSNYAILRKNKSNYVDLGFNRLYNKNKPLFPIFAKFLKDLYAWCDTCDHYIKNNCYFSMEEINEIKKLHGRVLGIVFNKIKCEMCGSQVFNIYNTMRKRYLEQRKELKIPLLCSKCNYDIQNGKVKRKIAFFIFLNILLLLPITLGSLILIFITFSTSNDIALISFILVYSGIMGIFAFFLIKRTFKLTRYKKILKHHSKEELLI